VRQKCKETSAGIGRCLELSLHIVNLAALPAPIGEQRFLTLAVGRRTLSAEHSLDQEKNRTPKSALDQGGGSISDIIPLPRRTDHEMAE
jgi:hypothetical protein